MLDFKHLPKADFTEGSQYVPMHLDYINLDQELPQDLYIRAHGHFIVFKRAGQQFTVADRDQLAAAENKIIYIYTNSNDGIRRFFESNLNSILESPKVQPEEKAEVLYQCALGIAEDIFEKPFKKETIERSRTVVNGTISLLADSSDAFLQMISLSGHDYYTYTHSVNVLTFTISLLNSMGFKDPKFLKEAGMGALLHDVGKSKVPIEILNKPGKLTEDEWKVMKQHPEYGAQIVENASLPERGVDVIIQHHERVNGQGYPHGLYGEAIPIASQAVSLADAYDAMTTNRVYQKARRPFEAFQIITQHMKDHYNPKLVSTFIQMLNLRKD